MSTTCQTGWSGPTCQCAVPLIWSGHNADFINDACGESIDDTSQLSTIYYLLLFINIPLMLMAVRRTLNMISIGQQMSEQQPGIVDTLSLSSRGLPSATATIAVNSQASNAPMHGPAGSAVTSAAAMGDGEVAVTSGRPSIWSMCTRVPAGIFTYALSGNAVMGVLWCILRLVGQRVGADAFITIVIGLWLQFFWWCPLLFAWSWFRVAAALAPISGISEDGIMALQQSASKGRRLLVACGLYSTHAPICMFAIVGIGASNPDLQTTVLSVFMIMEATLCLTISSTIIWLAQCLMKIVQLGDDIPIRKQEDLLIGADGLPAPAPIHVSNVATPPVVVVQPVGGSGVVAPTPSAPVVVPPPSREGTPVSANGGSSLDRPFESPGRSLAAPGPLRRGPSSHNVVSTPANHYHSNNENNNTVNGVGTPRESVNTNSAPGTPTRPPQYLGLRVVTGATPSATPRTPAAAAVGVGSTPGTNASGPLPSGPNGITVNESPPPRDNYLRLVRAGSTVTNANVMGGGREGPQSNGQSLYDSQLGGGQTARAPPTMSLPMVIARQLRCTQFTMVLLIVPVPITFCIFGLTNLVHRAMLWFPVLAIISGLLLLALYKWIHHHTDRLGTLASGGTITLGVVGGGMARISGATSQQNVNANNLNNNYYNNSGMGINNSGHRSNPDERPSAATQVLVAQRLTTKDHSSRYLVTANAADGHNTNGATSSATGVGGSSATPPRHGPRLSINSAAQLQAWCAPNNNTAAAAAPVTNNNNNNNKENLSSPSSISQTNIHHGTDGASSRRRTNE
jgi:hypothetical protein